MADFLGHFIGHSFSEIRNLLLTTPRNILRRDEEKKIGQKFQIAPFKLREKWHVLRPEAAIVRCGLRPQSFLKHGRT